MRQKKGLVLRDVCGEKVIIGEGLEAVDFGRLMCLNETAALLWEKASEIGDFTIEDRARVLCEEYEVSKEEAHQDVTAIIEKWKETNIIEYTSLQRAADFFIDYSFFFRKSSQRRYREMFLTGW